MIATRRIEPPVSMTSTIHQVPKCGSARPAAVSSVDWKSKESPRQRLVSARKAKWVRSSSGVPNPTDAMALRRRGRETDECQQQHDQYHEQEEVETKVASRSRSREMVLRALVVHGSPVSLGALLHIVGGRAEPDPAQPLAVDDEEGGIGEVVGRIAAHTVRLAFQCRGNALAGLDGANGYEPAARRAGHRPPFQIGRASCR